MGQYSISDGAFPAPPKSLFTSRESPAVRFPIQRVEIDWARLQAKRPLVLDTVQAMPAYLLYPEVVGLLAQADNPAQRLVLDLMWSTGARVSEVLALKPTSFVDDGYDFGVILQTLKQKSGRPSKKMLARSAKRYVPIQDRVLKDRIQSFLWAGHFKKTDRIFPMCRQTVNRYIHKLVDRVGGGDVPFNITAHTFRHSFAVHLLLHGRPLKAIGQLLGHRSLKSTEIYTEVLSVDVGHFLDGVAFH
ncbi:tyrosine-type recombinase/integrase [Simiduia agarivorans]|uniref:Phage integrase family protein n=1 Tax=Simiduia agarivorans (strain DSM 21679 / JCM 13881 / BCRC 17597 / SA1) TaxID=1117647 RepID=K4KIL3_SIMAS|nr:tyrosine-type recombinase/integrase [Simiduia agarivorans]AFU97808.1 phage integrase family protein [Simiduia agarivorans SA1 = DSM 21679]